ncbi:hypothetical protein T01_14441 [Trichinella spiralis]|uniref:Uncharacterized protein n=1 Tax=Trichinella spiralis TaxID=6334 RepID=A0A0V1B8D1_TRISP|nr:hypothetical protein T01_14441 [Trichinella spiralis]
MYLQVRLQVEDRDACRFLWSNCSQHTPARVYLLTRLTINVINAHVKQNPEECDEVIQRALSNIHVDNLLMSYDEKSEMAELIRRGRCEFITS